MKAPVCAKPGLPGNGLCWLAAWVGLVSTIWAAVWPGPALAAAPPPPHWPQIRLDHVDASQFPLVRLLATVLDKQGRPVPPKLLSRLEVLDGKSKAQRASKDAPALVWFSGNKAMEGRKDATLLPRDKSTVPLAVAVVVQGFAEGVPADTQERIRESAALALGGLAKQDRAAALWYGDRLLQSVRLANEQSRLADVERLRGKCQHALEAARTGLALDAELVGRLGKDAPPPSPGDYLCGLSTDHKQLAKLVKQQAFSGAFPRLFALGPAFFQPTRYCATPPGQLDGFGELVADNYNKQVADREVLRARNAPLDFETGALDEALRLVLTDARPREQRALVLIADGRDGYVRDLQLCQDHPPPPCNTLDRTRDKTAFSACLTTALQGRMAQQQAWFRAKAEQWTGLARAGQVRIFAVGIGTLGASHELERLRLLAERTGGTFRSVDDDAKLADAVAKTMAELSGQLVLEFNHRDGEDLASMGDEPRPVAFKVSATLGKGLQNDGVLVSQPQQVVVPAQPDLRTRIRTAGLDQWLALEARFGRRLLLGVAVGMAVVIGLVVLLVVALVLRRLWRKGRAAKPS